MNNDNNLEFCIAGLNCRAGYATVYSFDVANYTPRLYNYQVDAKNTLYLVLHAIEDWE